METDLTVFSIWELRPNPLTFWLGFHVIRYPINVFVHMSGGVRIGIGENVENRRTSPVLDVFPVRGLHGRRADGGLLSKGWKGYNTSHHWIE